MILCMVFCSLQLHQKKVLTDCLESAMKGHFSVSFPLSIAANTLVIEFESTKLNI